MPKSKYITNKCKVTSINNIKYFFVIISLLACVVF